MGFYDDDFETKRKPSGGGLGKMIGVAVLAAVVGSGTTLALVPKMIENRMIEVQPDGQAAPVASSNVGAKQTVNLNVQSGIVEAVNKVKPAVVGVINLQKGKDFFGRSIGEQQRGTGSGVVIDSKGYIVTNNHVVEGADSVEIKLEGKEKPVKAKVVGTDPMTDLAVVKVDEKDVEGITPATLGSSDGLNIGEPAIAIGNPLGLSFAQTVTVGVISATKRELPIDDQNGNEMYSITVLQTDAAINPGNSGGALVNIKGEVVGINSAKIASSGVEGIGFAIPIDEAKPIIQELTQNGKIVRPMLGVSVSALQDIPVSWRPPVEVEEGLLVRDVFEGAAKAGLKKMDIITKVDGQKVEDFVTLRKVLFKKKPGDKVKVEFYRGTELKTVEVELSKPSE
jgi:serine protease Do